MGAGYLQGRAVGKGGPMSLPPPYKGYCCSVEYDNEDKVFHGRVVLLGAEASDIVTFEADTFDGVAKAFQDSVDDYLAFKAGRR